MIGSNRSASPLITYSRTKLADMMTAPGGLPALVRIVVAAGVDRRRLYRRFLAVEAVDKLLHLVGELALHRHREEQIDLDRPGGKRTARQCICGGNRDCRAERSSAGNLDHVVSPYLMPE